MPDLNGTLSNDAANGTTNGTHYSVPEETSKIFKTGILSNPLITKDLPPEAQACAAPITFTGSDNPSLPINWRFAESVSALKALEATVVNILLGKKYGLPPQEVEINTDHATLFVMSTLLWIIDPGEGGLNISPANLRGAGAPGLEDYFPSQDVYKMASSLHRQVATNIYKCADDRYFHLHGSLDPGPSLESIGLPSDSDASTYENAVAPFIEAMAKIPSEEMQKRASDQYKQAGTICYSMDEFCASEHGKANAHVGLWEIHDKLNPKQPAGWWPDAPNTSPARPLAGLKVVDLTRIIAAPAITRSLAELGASVMRCTAPHLPDYGALHVDLNWGKWNCSIDMRDQGDREKLKALILDADVVVQGYRPGVLDKYGFGLDDVVTMCADRPRGIISVRENCYGWSGPWVGRSGWQQISDANTGVSLAFGQAMGLNEPVTPVFPNSDYCTGIAGSVSILLALLRRAERGGSYIIDCALNYYNFWLVNSVGTYPTPVFDKVWEEHKRRVYRNFHGMGYSIPAVMEGLKSGGGAKRLFQPQFWEDRLAEGVLGKGKKIRTIRPIPAWKGEKVKLGYNVGTRGNGVDRAFWPEDLSVERVA